jgi:shikimate dehydrogenase
MIKPEQKKLFAVVGNPVRHSLSPVMMNAAFRVLGLPAIYTALFIDEPDADLGLLHKIGFSGLSVTIPFKEMACRMAEEIDDTAKEIGAVNTLRRTAKGWEGRNTDWIGALRALSAAVDVGGKNVLILGAGGAAKAVAYGLHKAKAVITIANRCTERGKTLAKQLKSKFVPLASVKESGDGFDIVVQCTSVGLEGGAAVSIVSDSFFKQDMTVMDIVYRPARTPFSIAATDAGCKVVSGLDMLLYQGVAQLEWWLEIPVFDTPAVEAMRKAMEEVIANEECG